MKLKSSFCDGGNLLEITLLINLGATFAVPVKVHPEVRNNTHRRISVNPKRYLSQYGYIEYDLHRMTFHHRQELHEAIRKTFELHTNATTHGHGAFLNPEYEGQKQVICFDIKGLKWRSHKLSWRMTGYTGRLPPANQWATIKKAFDQWEEQTTLTLTYNSTHPDMEVMFGRWSHGDGDQYAFDGRGPQLAHAFGPGDASIAGDVHFDDDERWTLGVNDSNSRDLFAVALHEAGHALGMPHSRDKNAIMYAQYKGYDPSTRLHYDDIRKIQYLYVQYKALEESWEKIKEHWHVHVFLYIHHRARTSSYPRAKSTESLFPTPNKPKTCSIPFDDVIYGFGGRGYAFSGRHLYRLTGVVAGRKRAKNSPYRVRKILRGAPIHISAAVYVDEKKRLYIFKGYRIWRYTRFRLEKDFPKKIKSHCPERPRAAVGIKDSVGNTEIYVFGTEYFWLYDQEGDKSKGPSMWIQTHWHGLPTPVDAVVQWGDGFLYFFRKDKYYKVSIPHRAVMAGYPKVKDESWLKSKCRAI